MRSASWSLVVDHQDALAADMLGHDVREADAERCAFPTSLSNRFVPFISDEALRQRQAESRPGCFVPTLVKRSNTPTFRPRPPRDPTPVSSFEMQLAAFSECAHGHVTGRRA